MGRRMTEQPDLSTLPKRMRYAATVLAEANERLNELNILGKQTGYLWGSSSLIKEAGLWEESDRAAADHDTQIDELARQIHAYDLPPRTGFFEVRDMYRAIARSLIESGWHK